VTTCSTPATWETLVAYWAGDLEAREEASLEEHLMGCASCTAASTRVADVTETLRAMIPPVVSAAELARLRDKGLRVREDSLAPGARHEAWFPADLDLLVCRLGGLELARARRVSLALRAEVTGKLMVRIDDASFDRDAGAVLLVCQQHFAVLPPVVIAELCVVDDAGNEARAAYTIDHRFERAPSKSR
jgi:hypothetical protein